MDTKETAKAFLENAERKWKATQTLFKNKHYVECLFFCHLSVELYLKAIVVMYTRKVPPYTHDLAVLAKLSQLSFSKQQLNLLEDMNEFNIRTRYEDYKRAFYKKATKNYTEPYIERIRALRLWIKKNIP